METNYNRDLIEGDFNLYHRHFRQFGDNGTLDNARQLLQCSYMIPSADLGQKWHISIKVGKDVLSFRSGSPATLRRMTEALAVIWTDMNGEVRELAEDQFIALAEQFLAELRRAIYQQVIEE